MAETETHNLENAPSDPHVTSETAPEDQRSHDACVTIEIASAPDEVWQSLTDDECMGDWMGDGATIGDAPGDDVFFPDVVTGVPRQGTISTYEENRRLAYTWWPQADDDQRTHVAITLEPCEVGTRVTVIETMPVARTGGPVAVMTTSAWMWRTAMLVLVATRSLAAVR